jgi:hypothetical protein
VGTGVHLMERLGVMVDGRFLSAIEARHRASEAGK